jgi:Carboxypeptidase regulatory-like domain/TonB dependent receptor
MQSLSRALIFGVFLSACFLASVAYGQQGGRGQINGTVTDSTGAVLPNAQVTITDTLTGQIVTVRTTSKGDYSAPFLETGTYVVSASHDGFSTETQNDLTLTADQVTAVNFTLKPGTTTTNVEVQASATEIDTSGGAISQVMDQKTLTELPLDGRNPAALVALAPGAIDGTQVNAISLPGVGSGSPLETAASVNGSRMGGVIYQLDGITNMNNYFQTASPFPNPDATQEFRVITNNFDAQYGYTSGGVVSIATRSGTNQWHGVAFEFLRNNVLNAKEYFTQVADPLKRNQFGGSVGGPIIHNKLFIFGNVEFTRERISSSSSGYQVPNNNELSGDFSQICITGFSNGICQDTDSAGNTINQIYKNWYDHSNANAYPNNQVNPATFSPFAVAFEQGLPKTSAANGLVNEYGVETKNNVYEYTIRSDYNITPSQVLSGHAFYDNYDRPPYSGPPNYLAGGTRSALDQVLNISISHIWTVRPNLVNDLRGGYSKNNSQAIPNMQAVGGGPLSFKALGSNLNTESAYLGQVATNGFSLSGIPVNQGRHNWTVDDTVSITKGKQSISAGFTFYTQFGLETATWEGDPLASFGGNVTNDSDTDFLLGLVNTVSSSGGEYNQYTSNNYAAFAQDTVKLLPTLTLGLGLRWEPQIAPVSILGHTADFYPGQQSTRYGNAPEGLVFPGDAGVPAGGWSDRWNNFMPRVSVAWAPEPTTTVRAAYGLMGLPYDYSYYNHQSANAPFSPLHNITYNLVGNCTLNIADPYGCYAPTGYKDPFPPYAGPSFIPPSNVAITLPVNLQAVFTRGFRLQMENTWNFSIEHAFKNDYLLTVAYIGHQDYHVPLPLEQSPGIFYCNTLGPNCTQAEINANGINRVYSPNFVSVLSYESVGTGSYNAFQVSVQKRFARGLQFTSNYTWSKNLDLNSEASESNVGSISNPYNIPSNYGISDLNTPQIWNNTFVYQSPKMDQWGRAASALLGNWELAGSWQFHSGNPTDITGGNNPAAIGAGDENASFADVYDDYANRVPGQALNVHKGSKTQWVQQYFNTGAFTFNPPGTFGNAGRNPLYGPGWNNANLMFAKNIAFRERYKVQFRWEMFNAFNRTEFSGPNSDFNTRGNGTFGQITSTNGNGPPRAMQAGLKLNF